MQSNSISIGNGAFLPKENISFYVTPGPVPYTRKVSEAKKAGKLIDTTSGKTTRSLIFLKTGEVVKSVLTSETIDTRFNKEQQQPQQASEKASE